MKKHLAYHKKNMSEVVKHPDLYSLEDIRKFKAGKPVYRTEPCACENDGDHIYEPATKKIQS